MSLLRKTARSSKVRSAPQAYGGAVGRWDAARVGADAGEQLADRLDRDLERLGQPGTVYRLRLGLAAFPTSDGGCVHPYGFGQALLTETHRLPPFGEALTLATGHRWLPSATYVPTIGGPPTGCNGTSIDPASVPEGCVAGAWLLRGASLFLLSLSVHARPFQRCRAAAPSPVERNRSVEPRDNAAPYARSSPLPRGPAQPHLRFHAAAVAHPQPGPARRARPRSRKTRCPRRG
jgi:hypothetical protein